MASMPLQREERDSVTPLTSLELLRRQVDELRRLFELLLDHTELKYDDINAGSSGMFFFGRNPHR